jgi:cystathionine beta-synthase
MNGVYNNVLEAIGHTPLIRLNKVAEQLPCPVYVKVEFFNPGGSIKDRIGKAMIEKAEREGLIKPGVTTIVEATAGNTGVGLALAAAVKGYRCIFVLPDKMSQEKIDLLRAFGAEAVIVPSAVPPDSPDSYGGVARRLLHEIPNAWQPNQFANLANPEIHELTTGPEIWEQTRGRITCFVCGIGTGGTISGVGKYLKERSADITVVGADPEGSVLSGGTGKPWKVEGIGEDYVPKTLNTHVIDEWVRVTDRESFMTARRIAREEGMLVGGSCGTCIAAALKYAERLSPDDLMVVMSPDTGRNYLSKCYNDDWMREHSRGPASAASSRLRRTIRCRPRSTCSATRRSRRFRSSTAIEQSVPYRKSRWRACCTTAMTRTRSRCARSWSRRCRRSRAPQASMRSIAACFPAIRA